MIAVWGFFRATWYIWVFLAVAIWANHLWGNLKEGYRAEGRAEIQALWDAQKVEDAKEIARLKALSEKVTEKIVTEYVEKVKIVHVKGETIIKEVKVYVTPENDAACTINRGFVSLWNNANQGIVSGAPSGADAEASEVRLSEVAAQHAREAKACRATEVQLEGLQDWVRAQGAVQ